ncbi:MAG: NAD(P)-dependent dehydrogenase (short-subunit alcohol dehydrogenase family), partial [Colwellia sp.]
MDPLLNFTGKVAVISGAAQGFGKLLAEGLAKRGAKLVISD